MIHSSPKKKYYYKYELGVGLECEIPKMPKSPNKDQRHFSLSLVSSNSIHSFWWSRFHTSQCSLSLIFLSPPLFLYKQRGAKVNCYNRHDRDDSCSHWRTFPTIPYYATLSTFASLFRGSITLRLSNFASTFFFCAILFYFFVLFSVNGAFEVNLIVVSCVCVCVFCVWRGSDGGFV